MGWLAEERCANPAGAVSWASVSAEAHQILALTMMIASTWRSENLSSIPLFNGIADSARQFGDL
jgi:hypothetical protein